MLQENINIKFIAEKANVSIATVSNVINSKGRVSVETALRVKEVIDSYQYSGNLAAKNLRTRKSYLFGVVVSLLQPEGRIKNNLFYWELVSGIESKAREKSFDIVLKGIESPEELTTFITQRNLDGLILVGAKSDSPVVAKVKELDLPIVFLDSYLDESAPFQVGIDDAFGGRVATEHLLSLGHQRIALITGDLEPDSVNGRRFRGYRSALQENRSFDQNLIFESDTSAQGGFEATEKIITETNATAILSFSDVSALGVYKCLNEKGCKIPDDYSVVGFDGSYFSTFMTPTLATVKQDVGEKGEKAVDLLFLQIEDANRLKQQSRISLPVTFMVGSSTAPPRSTRR
ncbi:LacI family DNA-binding transcriptional regulator [Peribacillus sp. FSL E2-0218]|uniref:LacI family DNA-binding transcriptional regulator n=1 Tax=Peribacillus sp. FSL E2-0218 TaxID=2921364 RepID=UPI0030EBD50B